MATVRIIEQVNMFLGMTIVAFQKRSHKIAVVHRDAIGSQHTSGRQLIQML